MEGLKIRALVGDVLPKMRDIWPIASKPRRRHPELRLERPVERADRPIAAVEREAEHRQVRLFRIGEARRDLAQAVVVQEGVEVSIAEVAVDGAAQAMLLRIEPLRGLPDAEARPPSPP